MIAIDWDEYGAVVDSRSSTGLVRRAQTATLEYEHQRAWSEAQVAMLAPASDSKIARERELDQRRARC